MEIKVNDKGKIELDISDILSHMSDDEADELIKSIAWDSRLWRQIKEVVKNEHGAFNWNEDLLKLRIAFLTEVDNRFDNPHERIKDVISALMTELHKQKETARNAENAYWNIYHLVSDVAREKGIKLPSKEHANLKFFHKEAEEIVGKYLP